MRVLTTLAIVTALAGCADGGLNLVPEAEVQQMGLNTWTKIKAETPRSADRALDQRAGRVATRVLKASGNDPSQWEVVVFRDNEPNAFALPGNKIGIHDSMMRLAASDEELAAIIGHEIGHNLAGHAGARVNSEKTAELGVDIAGIVLGNAGGLPPQMTAGLLGAGVQYGLLLPYSRNQELEADRLGLSYSAMAGFDPRGAITLWQKMAGRGGAPPAFLSTHPAPDQRIKELEALMPQAMAEYRAASR